MFKNKLKHAYRVDVKFISIVQIYEIKVCSGLQIYSK